MNRVMPLTGLLFNCCTGGKEPDWQQFDGIEIAPLRTELLDPENPDEGTTTDRVDHPALATHWGCSGILSEAVSMTSPMCQTKRQRSW